MKHWLEFTTFLLILLLFSACNRNARQSELIINDNQSTAEQSLPDTTVVHVQETNKNEEKTISPTISSSSSQYNQLSSSDNMRGFDPASEDDMDDNGMSRYMENNDEEGWD